MPKRSTSRSKRPTRKAPKRPMKKVTKRGAYNKAVKRQTMIRRNPLVENKIRTSSEVAIVNGHDIVPREFDSNVGQYDTVAGYNFLTEGSKTQPLNWRMLPNDDAFTLIPFQSFNRMSQGLKSWQMIGNDITVKALNTRLEVRFPQGELFTRDPALPLEHWRNMQIQENVKVYAIWGYVTNPVNSPLEDLSGDRIPLENFTQEDLKQYLASEIKPYFDDSTDKLSFRPKMNYNIYIEKYVRLKPALDSAIPTRADPVTVTRGTQTSDTGGTPMQIAVTHEASGSIPNVMRSHSFTMNRKIPYTEGKATAVEGEVDTENYFPNNSYIPFLIIYNPDYKNLQAQANSTGNTVNPSSRTVFNAGERRCSNLFYRYNDQTIFTDS